MLVDVPGAEIQPYLHRIAALAAERQVLEGLHLLGELDADGPGDLLEVVDRRRPILHVLSTSKLQGPG